MKMEPIGGSETSAISTQTPGKHPKENILHILLFLTNYSCFDNAEIIHLLTEDNYNCEDRIEE
jgi:hypothetical protein